MFHFRSRCATNWLNFPNPVKTIWSFCFFCLPSGFAWPRSWQYNQWAMMQSALGHFERNESFWKLSNLIYAAQNLAHIWYECECSCTIAYPNLKLKIQMVFNDYNSTICLFGVIQSNEYDHLLMFKNALSTFINFQRKKTKKILIKYIKKRRMHRENVLYIYLGSFAENSNTKINNFINWNFHWICILKNGRNVNPHTNTNKHIVYEHAKTLSRKMWTEF